MRIVESMLLDRAKGTTGNLLQRLRASLQEPLISVADFERHMKKLMLASKKLKATDRRGKNPYERFETFLETVRGFPVVTQTLSTYYATHTTIDRHTIASKLFPHLKAQHAFMPSLSTAFPFSGAVSPASAHVLKSNNKTR
jgi:hypothetical protein